MAKGLVDIVELPYGMWTSDFKDRLTKMLEEGEVSTCIHSEIDGWVHTYIRTQIQYYIKTRN